MIVTITLRRRAGGARLAAWALLLTCLVAACGCGRGAGGPDRSVAAAGEAAAAQLEEKAATPPPKSDAPANRFTALPRSAAAGVGVPAGPAAAAPGPGATPQKSPSRLEGFVDPLTKRADRVPITLESCLRRALVGNQSIQIARFGPAIAQTGVVEAEALFDPSWFLNNALGRIRRNAGSFLAGATTLVAKQWDFSSGVDTLLPTGGSVSVGQAWTYVDSNSAFFQPNPQYATGLGVALRQPLLRGAGVEVTRSPIVLATLDHTISQADFAARVMTTLLDVEQAYWDLASAQFRVQALAEALAAAQENQRIARRRFEEGKDTRLVLSLANSAVTSRQADLVAARLVLVQTSDRLKRLANDPQLPLKDPAVLEATELPMTEPIRVGREMLQSSMLVAMAHRPQMQQAEAALEQTGLRERVARNALLPQLDLAAGYTLTGLNADTDRALSEQFETRFFDWTVGLELRVPIGNRGPSAAHERSVLERSRALHEREDVRQQILLEVSDAVRNLASAEEAILACRAARQAAEQTLGDQQANVAAGAALVKDLLDSQRDLADAKVREMEAMAAYMVGLAALERAKGTLLEYNHISILDEASEVPPPAGRR
ncbi:MAG TPA: TolC family protein [Phycisphaerae bacterium]|nr:TolC family protein [Phycisphaerae bacterium]